MNRNERIKEYVLSTLSLQDEEIAKDILELIEEVEIRNERLEISPQGDDKIDELESVIAYFNQKAKYPESKEAIGKLLIKQKSLRI